MIILVLIATAVLCSYIVWVLQWSRTWRIDTKVPVLKGGLPFIGHSYQMLGDTTHLWEYLKYLSYQTIDNGGILKGYLGPMPYYMVTDPKIAMKISNTCLQKHYLYKFASNWIGEGLITAYESTWKRHRKLLNPTFNQHILDGFVEVFNRQSEHLTGKFSEHVGKGQFNHWPYLADNALEIVCKTVFGIEEANSDVIDLEYKKAVARIFNILISRFTRLWLHSNFIYSLTPSKREEDKVVAVLKKMSSNVIEKKQAARQKTAEKPAEYSTRKFRTFLDQLLELEAEGALTTQEIREEVDNMIVAAHDTSSAAIMYTLVLIGSYPEVQEKMYQEIKEVFGDSDRDVSKDDMNKLVYIEAVIKESLRIYPVGPMMARCAEEDVEVEGYIIPNGAAILLSVWGIHRNRVYWGQDAEEFKPERWFDAATLPEHPAAFAAFSMGKRGCMGKTYALMSMKSSLVHLLKRFRVTADHTKMRFKFDVMLKPVDGHEISLENRN